MKITNPKLLEKVENFLKSITKQDKIAIIHHTDPDGVSSGVLAAKIIEKIRNKKIDLRHNQDRSIHGFTNESVELLKKNKINKVITTDISSEENYENWKKIEKFAEILIIDHHPTIHDSTIKTTIIKPQLFLEGIQSVKYCASKLVYDIASRITDFSENDWISCIGIIGDVASTAWEEFLEETFKKHKFKKGKDWFDTILGEGAKTISSVECYDDKLTYQTFEILYNAKKPEDLINSEIKKYTKLIDEEIQYWIKNLETKAEIHPEIETIYYEIQPKYDVKSVISTILGIKYPNKTIFTVTQNKETTNISARRGDFTKKTNEMLKKATENIPNAMAGGHPVSSGARIPTKYYAKFKEKLFEILKDEL